MIRKWSYIKNFSLDFINDYRNISSRYKFKVFKISTRFKTYSIGKTNIIRKISIIRKRTTSLLPLSVISHQWSIFYIHLKQLNRYIQSLNQFNFKFPLISTKYILNKSSLKLIDNFNLINIKLSLCKYFKNVRCSTYLYMFNFNPYSKSIPGLTSVEYTNNKYPINMLNIKKYQYLNPLNHIILNLNISLLFRRVFILIILLRLKKL